MCASVGAVSISHNYFMVKQALIVEWLTFHWLRGVVIIRHLLDSWDHFLRNGVED